MVTISGKKAHAILNSLLSMLSSFLNYSESGGEIKTCLYHYQSYYNSIKGYLRIDQACLPIEEVARSIESSMQYLGHY